MPAFEGKGVGSALAKHVIPVCQFVAAYIRKHREYANLLRMDVQRAFKI